MKKATLLYQLNSGIKGENLSNPKPETNKVNLEGLVFFIHVVSAKPFNFLSNE